MQQQQTEQTVLLHVHGWATGPLHPEVAGLVSFWPTTCMLCECWRYLPWTSPLLLAFSLSLFSFWLTPPSPHTVWCPHNLWMTSYQWYCSVAAILCFILLSNVIMLSIKSVRFHHLCCGKVCVVARKHEAQFLSLNF